MTSFYINSNKSTLKNCDLVVNKEPRKPVLEDNSICSKQKILLLIFLKLSTNNKRKRKQKLIQRIFESSFWQLKATGFFIVIFVF